MKNRPNALGALRKLLFLGAALVGGLIVVGPAQSATTLYVSPFGGDSAGCGPQNSPCRNIDYAVSKALTDDTIIVAGGTYQITNTPTCDRNVVCVFNKSITILGGYDPFTWNLDPVTNPTVIDGQSAYRGIFVLAVNSPNMRLTMSNVTIQDAVAGGTDADPTAYGGAMRVDNAAVTLDSVTFLNNQTVGANTSSGQGGSAAGGALAVLSSPPSGAVSFLTNVLFQGNTSFAGLGPAAGGVAFGALFVFGSTVDVQDSDFLKNRAIGGPSSGIGTVNGQSALGGAVGADGQSVVSLARVKAKKNRAVGGAATQHGGGAFGGAIYIENSTVTIVDSLVILNVVRGATSTPEGGFGGGGGVMLFNSAGTINRTRVIANHVTGGVQGGGGGGVYLWRTIPELTLPKIQVLNTVIADNRFELGDGVNAGGGGGGIQVQGLVANLRQVTLSGNELGPGLVAGQAMLVNQFAGPGIATLQYSAVADHVAATPGATAVVVTDGNFLTLKRGAFSGNTHDTNSDGIPVPPGTITNLGSMLTLAVPAGFVSPGPPNYDYHITATSPLRDTPTGSTSPVPLDMDGQFRTDGMPDIGADEYVPVP